MRASGEDENLSPETADDHTGIFPTMVRHTNDKTTEITKGVEIFEDDVVSKSSCHIIENDESSLPGTGPGDCTKENAEQKTMKLERMRAAVRTLLECIGENADREGLMNTPSRYAEALLFLTGGYQINTLDAVNNALFSEDNDEMVIVKDIEISSLCEHHLLPFTGKMHIGYIPCGTVIGLSKLVRIAEIYSRRLQIQERLTKDVAYSIMEMLKPQGVAVLMESTHMCMGMRGVEKTSSTTLTRCMLGCFDRNSKARDEFSNLVRMSR